MEPWPDQAGTVTLPDGRRVRGRGLRRPLPEGPEPQFAVYLLGWDPGPFRWPYQWVRWRDFGLPRSTDEAVAALRELHGRAGAERVEIACGGGIGRTGTALAGLAILTGLSAEEATTWVRGTYHRRAVETPWQRGWLRRLEARGARHHGG